MTFFRSMLAFAGVIVFAVSSAVAQTPAPPEPLGVRIDIPTHLGLDAKRAAQVESIVGEARSRMVAARAQPAQGEAVRAETEAKLAKVLTAEEMKRLRTALPPAGVKKG